MTWSALKLGSLVPTQVTSGVSDVSTAITAFTRTIQQNLDIMQAFQRTLEIGAPSIFAQTVSAISGMVEALLQTGKVHVLFVPIAKVVDRSSTPTPGTLESFCQILGFDLDTSAIDMNPSAAAGYAQLANQSGGNRGFFNTIAMAIADSLDPNRPQYDDPKDAVAVTILMAGAPTFAEIVEVGSAFNGVFGTSGNDDLTARTIPSPQGLRSKVIAVPTANTLGVRLDWETPQPAYALPFFPGVTTRVARYAVIRSTHKKAMDARTVLDLFTTRTLTKGLKSNDAAKTSEVIAVGSGMNSSYVDDSKLDATKTYYYTVAWEVEVTEKGKKTTLPFDKVASVVKVNARAAASTQNSLPPDWLASPTLIDVMPGVAVTLRTMIEQLKALADTKTGVGLHAGAALNLSSQMLTEALSRVDDMNASLQRLTAQLARPLPALYATTYAGLGGNAFLMGELAARLEDRTDENRPPFDGHEYVTGVCIVGGAPRLADVQALLSLMQLLFQTPEDDHPLSSILQTIDNVVTQQEAAVTFGPGLQNMPMNTDGTVTLPDGTTADPATIDPLTGLPTVTPGVTISESGVPVSGESASNPNAGFTNKIALRDLC